MLELPWTTVRGLHLLKALARHGGPVKAVALAREAGVTPSRLRLLLGLLAQADLVESRPRQGWTLAREPHRITVLEVVEALDPHRARPAHCRADWGTCDDRGGCALAPVCRQAHDVLQETFRRQTLADLQAEMPALP
jgi:Rrf2 family protein